jgi:N-acetylglucosaminyldiphosphoundecaprenol N-acetyl-beta-D-mannosaminyltransferase
MAVTTLIPSTTIDPLPNQARCFPAEGLLHSTPAALPGNAPIPILGVPFDNVTTQETITLVERMVASRQPHYLVTANVDFLVQALHDVELRRILFEAHLVLCDGTPLVWASRWLGNPLPERVAGSDLVPLLIRIAAERGYRLFFLGGAPETTLQAVERLQVLYPSLAVAGHYSPPFSTLLDMDHDQIRRRIQTARPDLLLVSFGCPKQEKWIAMHYRSLGVPVCIGVGGTIDFLAGRLARAPRWMQQTGTEWVFRLAQEPRRLLKRYLKDGWYFGGALLSQWCRMQLRTRRRPASSSREALQTVASRQELVAAEWLDADAVQRGALDLDRVLAGSGSVLLQLAKVRFIDSTGVGLLIRLRKRLTMQGRSLVLVAPSPAVRRALESMRLWPLFLTAEDPASAEAMLEQLAGAESVVQSELLTFAPNLVWQGEVTAANADHVWAATHRWLLDRAAGSGSISIDLGRVSFIDSTGLAIMIRARKEAQKGGRKLCFENLQSGVRNVVRLARLESFLLEG